MPEFKNESTYRHFTEHDKEADFDAFFDSAVERLIAKGLGKRYPLCINGKDEAGVGEIEERSPIDGALIGRFQRADRAITRNAINAASVAFDSWSAFGYRERAAIFDKAADLFSESKFDLAAALSVENGKSRYESVGEVDEAIDFMRYYSADVVKNKGYVRRTSIAAGKMKLKAGFQGAPGSEESVKVVMKPYGVFGVLAPFNFPVSIGTGMSCGALITGNTVVFKPSSTDNMTMLTGYMMYKLFEKAGMPPGVFNYVTGPGSEVGDEFVVSPAVAGIAFTGSRKTGMSMINKAFGMDQQKAFIVEMGGKNPVIVSKFADMERAVQGVASASFGFCGQKCSAASRVYVHASVKEEFISKLIDQVRTFRIGNPLRKENYMGPLIAPAAFDRYRKAVDEANAHGRVIYGGKKVDAGLSGIYVEPTIVEVDERSYILREELFAPILAVVEYNKFDEAMQMANDTPYGLTAGLYSGKSSEIKEFLNKIEAGVVYVNRETSATTGAIVGVHTFVGWKGSALTGKGTGSRFYLQQFMREQSESIAK